MAFRALSRNAGAGTIVQGGSTITQQLVKIQSLANERTYARKLREVCAAVWLEMHLDKYEILTRYLNSVYMGAGAYGIPAAARLYFGKLISQSQRFSQGYSEHLPAITRCEISSQSRGRPRVNGGQRSDQRRDGCGRQGAACTTAQLNG